MSIITNITVCIDIFKNSYICMYTYTVIRIKVLLHVSFKQSHSHYFKCCMQLKMMTI